MFPHRYRDSDGAPILVMVFVLVALIGIVWLIVSHNDKSIQEKIDNCVERGGTPIVVGHAYTSEFKACVFPQE